MGYLFHLFFLLLFSGNTTNFGTEEAQHHGINDRVVVQR